jgi:hypothetical protein
MFLAGIDEGFMATMVRKKRVMFHQGAEID